MASVQLSVVIITYNEQRNIGRCIDAIKAIADEIVVIKVLKLKNGSTTQSTLRIATGFSKATLSRLLMELEQRKIIVKEKKGNKNLIILKSSVWNNLEQ